MSLILEALRKLERDKPDQARHTTVLIAPLAWPQAARRNWLGIALSSALLVVLVAAGWFLLRSALQPATPLAQATPGQSPTPPPTPTALHTPSLPLANARISLPGPPARRTTKPATPKREATSIDFRLTAIGDQEGVSVAVINDRLVRVGDSLLGARVLRISEAEVELVSETDGHHFTLGF